MGELIGGGTPRTRLRRLPELAHYERQAVYEVLDATAVCQVATIVDASPLVLPTLFVRDGDRLLLHGSRSSRLLRAMLAAPSVCVSVTIVDGIIVARSSFNSSMAYRSATVFGPAALLETDQERNSALELLIDRLLPGRSKEVRPSSASELSRTSVVTVAIEEASAKVSTGPPEDDEADIAGEAWAGVVPLRSVVETPIPAPDGAVGRGEVELPDSVRRLVEG